MTIDEIVDVLEETGLPYAYHHFAEGEAPALPYIIYTYPESIPFAADGVVYAGGMGVQIELYTEVRDLETEQRLERVLDDAELVYHKSEIYIESERLYEILYEMEVAVMG